MQWDFQNKQTLTSPARLSFVLKVQLHYLRPSVIYSVLSGRLTTKNSEIVQNSDKSVKFSKSSTGHGKSIILQCLPDLCRELFLRRFPYPSNAIVVVVCPLNSLVKSHIRELHTRGITAK